MLPPCERTLQQNLPALSTHLQQLAHHCNHSSLPITATTAACPSPHSSIRTRTHTAGDHTSIVRTRTSTRPGKRTNRSALSGIQRNLLNHVLGSELQHILPILLHVMHPSVRPSFGIALVHIILTPIQRPILPHTRQQTALPQGAGRHRLPQPAVNKPCSTKLTLRCSGTCLTGPTPAHHPP